MVALSETEYEQLKRCKVDTSDLIWPQDTSTEREQKLYALSLRKARENFQQTSEPSVSDSTIDSTIEKEIEHFPANSRRRAQRLLNSLIHYKPALNWNEKGEVIFGPHGSSYAGTHILDLIHYATAIKRRNYQPSGWNEFLNKLKEFNIASSMLNAETVREMRGEGVRRTLIPRKRLKRGEASESLLNWESIA